MHERGGGGEVSCLGYSFQLFALVYVSLNNAVPSLWAIANGCHLSQPLNANPGSAPSPPPYPTPVVYIGGKKQPDPLFYVNARNFAMSSCHLFLVI